MKPTLRIDIQALREKRKLNYTDASKLIGISRNAIYVLEKRMTTPTTETLRKIIAGLKLTDDEIKEYITIDYDCIREHTKIN